MTIVLRVGLIVIAVITIVAARLEFFMPKSVDCRQSVSWNESAPHGAIWTKETIHWDQVPTGYTTAVGWINGATSIPCFDVAAVRPEIEIRQISVIGLDQNGVEVSREAIDPRDPTRFVGRIFPRIPHWFGETEGESDSEVITGGEDGIALDIATVPLRVFHAWTNPRLPINSELQYVVEVEAKVSSTARLQLGLDYWRDAKVGYSGWDPNCVTSANCEGFVSDWFGDTGGEFRVFQAPARVNLSKTEPAETN